MSRQRRSYLRPVEVAGPYALVALALIGGGLAIPGFLSLSHLSSMSGVAAHLGIIAIGQTLVLLLGGIDLSVPYLINLSAVLLVGFQVANFSGPSDFALVLVIGLGLGLVNGLGVALLDISPLVMTLGMNSILQGIAVIYTGGSPQGFPPAFVTTLATGTGAGIPYVVLLWVALIVLVTLVLVFSRFGRSIYSVGSNRTASALCGLLVKRTIIAAYAISGLSCALGGILLVGYQGSAYIGMGDNYLLPSVAIVVIGGTSLAGGKGSYIQTVAGALLITVLQSALVTINVNQAGQDVLYGVVILLMAYFNQVAVSREGGGSKAWLRGLHGLGGWLEPVGRRGDVVAPIPEPVREPVPRATGE